MIGQRQFHGIFPSVDPRSLPEGAARRAVNCWLDRGYPRPIPNAKLVTGAPTFPSGTQAIYRFDGTGVSNDRWFAWDEDVDVVKAPVIDDTVNRVIWTGDDFPRYTSTEIMQGSSFTSPGVPVSRKLGVPAPENRPTGVLGTPFTPDDNMLAESHSYIYTWLSDLDEEGPPSPPSAVLEREFDSNGAIRPVVLTLPTSLTGPYGINRKRIYRTSTGGASGTTFRLVATIPLAQASYTDNQQTSELGDSIITTLWDPPPDDLTGLIALPNGVLAGFKGRDVYFSEPYQPHAWPTDYIRTVDFDIVGLGAFGVNVVVGTKGRPYLISGANVANTAVSRMEFEQPCAAKRSFASVDLQGIVYASHEGLVLVGPGGGQFLTREMYDRAEWRGLSPADFRASYHDGSWVGFNTQKGLCLNPEMKGAVETDDSGVKAIFRDETRDTIYLVDSAGKLREWKTEAGTGDTLRTFKWRSRIYPGKARTFNTAQVLADAYPVKLILYGDGISLVTFTVNSSAPFRLPSRSVSLHSDWEYEVESAYAVREVRVGKMTEMIGGYTAPTPPPPPPGTPLPPPPPPPPPPPMTTPMQNQIPVPLDVVASTVGLEAGDTDGEWFCTFEYADNNAFTSATQAFDTIKSTIHSASWTPPADAITYIRARFTTETNDAGVQGRWSAEARYVPPVTPQPTVTYSSSRNTGFFNDDPLFGGGTVNNIVITATLTSTTGITEYLWQYADEDDNGNLMQWQDASEYVIENAFFIAGGNKVLRPATRTEINQIYESEIYNRRFRITWVRLTAKEVAPNNFTVAAPPPPPPPPPPGPPPPPPKAK